MVRNFVCISSALICVQWKIAFCFGIPRELLRSSIKRPATLFVLTGELHGTLQSHVLHNVHADVLIKTKMATSKLNWNAK